MTSPIQMLETKFRFTNRGKKGVYGWFEGINANYKLEDPNRRMVQRDVELAAQIDELIVKGLAGQKKLHEYIRKLNAKVPGCIVEFKDIYHAIKKRETIRNKIVIRNKKPKNLNDVSRATVKFKFLDEMYEAYRVIRKSNSYANAVRACIENGIDPEDAHKNRWLKGVSDGEYKDIKLFLGFKLGLVGKNPIWVTELQLNLVQANEKKSLGHGIYEITRLWDGHEAGTSITIAKDRVVKIAEKLRTCWSKMNALSNKNEDVMTPFNDFLYHKFDGVSFKDIMDKSYESGNYNPDDMKIPWEYKAVLDDMTKAVYKYSTAVTKNAMMFRQGHLEPVIGNDQIMKKDIQ